MNHEHHHHEHKKIPPSRLAVSATTHCLMGCGLGEVAGVIITTAVGMATFPSMVLSVILGFIGGTTLGVGPWMKSGLSFRDAIKRVLIAEGLSILVMESAEVLIELSIPGLLNATFKQAIYWYGFALALAAGWIAAYPVNFILAKKGVTHKH